MTDDNWRTRANCAGDDPDAWFPDAHSRKHHTQTLADARIICATCPVREPCLESAIGEEFGIWAGTSEEERRAMRKRAGYRRRGSEIVRPRWLGDAS